MKCYIKDYPRPQFVRNQWENFNGTWDFAFDDSNVGETEKWYQFFPKVLQIQVPFTYETKAGGIHDETRHDYVWYHRTFEVDSARLQQNRYVIHFEGSDYITKVWVNGQLAGSHQGGYARFSFDITDLLMDGENQLTVKVEDSFDLHQPRGKQRWKEENYGVFYTQTTGIWKTVWSEYVPTIHIVDVKMTPNIRYSCLELEANIAAPDTCMDGRLSLETSIFYQGHLVNRTCTVLTDVYSKHIHTRLDLLSAASDIVEPLVHVWSPESPSLYDISFRILENESPIDAVDSYFAMREITIEGDQILLNGSPLYQRLLLDQGYWTDTLLTPPSEEALIEDIDKIQLMGFNGVRKHQKVEDERFLYWCDVKGLLVWSEMAAAFLFSEEAVANFTREWLEIVKQNYNHPCIITWTPFNESWGIPHIMKRRDQQHFTQAIYHLTKSIDPYRPVITNDGWEHTISDIITIHDYGQNSAKKGYYLEHKDQILSSLRTPYGMRNVLSDGFSYQGQPVIISECGGMALRSEALGGGYGDRITAEELVERFTHMVKAIREVPYICGYCYTQVTDVQQEINGFMDMDRNFKIDPQAIRRINML